jgi:Na+/melibiose symporter-like transporter
MSKKTKNDAPDRQKLTIKSMIGTGGEFRRMHGHNLIILMIFFTDVAMISGAAAGIIFMVGRIYDDVTDPIMGYISDHTHTR